MIGLTGSAEDVAAAIRNYDVYAFRQDPVDGDDTYFINHSAFTYLVLPDRGHVATFERGLTADELAPQVACYLDAALS